MSVTVSPAPFLYFPNPNNSGSPAAGYKLFQYIAGTSTKQNTWTDSTQTVINANPLPLDANGFAAAASSSGVWLDPTLSYKFVLALPTDTDPPTSPIRTVDNFQGFLTASSLYALLGLGQSAAEIAAGVVPLNYAYQPGDLRRYGAIGGPAGSIPGPDDSVAWSFAVRVGYVIIPQGMAFKVASGTSFTGRITIVGFGPTSEVYCDSSVISVISGTGSVCDNFALYNITTPYVITRNPASWGTTITTAAQSNSVLGYQPTINDPEYPTLFGLYGAPLAALISPTLTFSGAASNITVSRIYGRFVCVLIQDATNSVIRDCVVRGGRGPVSGGSGGGGGSNGCLVFDNVTNRSTAMVVGVSNRLINNIVQYASFSGCVMLGNTDGQVLSNSCTYVGESGVKTNSPTFPCIRMQVNDNECSNNFYDGLDVLTQFPGSDLISSYNQFEDNVGFRNGGDGINVDGKYNIVAGNSFTSNYRYGLYNYCSYSQISNNVCIGNNVSNVSSQAELLAGQQANNVSGNYVVQVAGSGYPIYGAQTVMFNVTATNASPCVFTLSSTANTLGNGMTAVLGGTVPTGFTAGVTYYTVASNQVAGTFELAATIGGTAINSSSTGTTVTASLSGIPNRISDNYCPGGTNFFGNPGAIVSAIADTLDAVTTTQTTQCFTVNIANNAGTIQNNFSSDPGTTSLGNLSSRIAGAGGTTNTPTGTDSSTAMAGGGKIGSATTNRYWFNTAAQNSLASDLIANIGNNTSGVALNVTTGVASISINGVTIPRTYLDFWNAGTGAAFALTTGNIGSGKSIQVQFRGKLA